MTLIGAREVADTGRRVAAGVIDAALFAIPALVLVAWVFVALIGEAIVQDDSAAESTRAATWFAWLLVGRFSPCS